jgi:hypothetical protein
MKVFYLFLGLFLLASIAVIPNVEAGDPIPAGLTSAIEHVKKMKRSGASRKDIAAYVTRTVANRVTFLNHKSKIVDSIMGDVKIEKQLKRYNAWIYKSDMVDDEFSAAVWVWENRIGQCNESASTAFHILIMAYESIDEITTLTKGDHRFVILGDIKNIPASFSADDLRKLDDTYIVDPWDGVSFSTKDLSFFDWYQHGQGNRSDEVSYKYYKREYNKWLTWCKKNPVEFQKWLHGDKRGEEIAEEKENMELFLNEYRAAVEELKKIQEKIKQDESTFFTSANKKIQTASYLRNGIRKYEALIIATVDLGKDVCKQARLSQKKISDSLAILVDGEALINSKIDTAKQRADNCKTDEDSVFVKTNYQSGKKTFSLMKKIMDAVREFHFNMKDKLGQLKKINDKLISIHDKAKWQKAKKGYDQYIEEVQRILDKLENVPARKDKLVADTTVLKNKVIKSQKYYIKIFPSSATEFNQLIKDLGLIKPVKIFSMVEIDDLGERYKTLENTSFYTGRQDKLLNGSLPLVNCLTIEDAKKMVDQSEEAFFWALLVIKDNELLSAGCSPVPSADLPEKSTKKPDPSTTSVTPPPNPTGTTPDKPPEKTIFGGLIIAGPSQITVGQGVSYIACDGAGDPYTKGSFAWNHSREDLLVLSRSGNPATGTAFKPGKVIIFVIYGGMKAYMDLEIKPKAKSLFSSSGGKKDNDNKNLFSSSGGEESDSDEDLFNSSGGEEDQTQASDETGKQFKQQCSELVDLIVWSLNRHDTDSAQRYTSRAVAFGCDINTAQVNSVVSQIRDMEKRKQEQLERERQQQLAAEARQRQLEARRRQAENNQQTTQAFQGMLNTFGQMMNNNSNQSGNKKYTSIKNPWPSSSGTQGNNNTNRHSQSMNNNPWKSSNSGTSSQTQNNNTPRGPACKGHTLTCNMGYGRAWKRALDVNNDGICDICGRSYKHSGNRVMAVIKKKGIQCREGK